MLKDRFVGRDFPVTPCGVAFIGGLWLWGIFGRNAGNRFFIRDVAGAEGLYRF